MRFLLDQPVSWMVGDALRAIGHEYVHVRDLGMARAADSTILSLACDEERVIITQDTDYGTLLARSGQSVPSVILLRLRDGRPSVQASMLLDVLPRVEAILSEGAIVVLTDNAVRIRKLPIG